MPASEHDGAMTDSKLIAALRAIRDEDFAALGLSARDREAVRLGQGEADYLIIDAMKVAARRALEDAGVFE